MSKANKIPNPSGSGKLFAWIVEHLGYQGDDCIKWPFSGSQGVGCLSLAGRHWVAPRLMCTLVNGLPPTSKHNAAHECGNGNRGCMNPKHLTWKTPVENRADCKRHGTDVRNPWGARRRLTPEKVYEIRALEGKETGAAVAALYDVSDDTIYQIWKRVRWGSLPARNESFGETEQ